MPTQVGTYAVNDGTKTSLTVVVGEAQLGHSTVFLGEQKICSRREVRDVELGDSEDIRGQILVVNTVVVDIQKAHDRTSVSVILTGGTGEPFLQSEEATTSGIVSYLTVVTLV